MTNPKHKHEPIFSRRRLFYYLITLAVLVLIYFKFGELQEIKKLFISADIKYLFIIIFTQLLSYYFLALNYRDVLKVKDLTVGLKELFPVTYIIQFLNQALPSGGISGQVFFIQYLKKYGLSAAEGIGRAVVELVTLLIAFGIFFIASVLIMFAKGTFYSHPKVAIFIYVFLFFAILFLFIFFAMQKRGRGKVVQWIIGAFDKYFKKRKSGGSSGEFEGVGTILDELRTNINIGELDRHRDSFFSACVWQGMVLLMNVITLYFIVYTLEPRISFGVAFVVFTLTKFLSMVSFVPGALGVFEGGMTLLLAAFGVPAQQGFAMTMLLRGFTFWLPMPIGWILYRYYAHRYELEHPYE